jgi:chemotaxis response regulator CheB
MYAITRTHLQFIFTIIAKNHKRVHVDAEGSCYKNAERGMDSRMNQAQTGRRPNAGKEADSKKPKGGTIFSPRYDSMPIVGVGASAGDLEAFEQLFAKMPKRNGMAFVVIQHLDPKQSGMLPEQLQRFTKMQVKLAEDGMKIGPNTIFVIPPNKDMSIIHGELLLRTNRSKRNTNADRSLLPASL